METGKLISERYQVLGVIGTGGMSVVYKALDTKENRTVAVKVLQDKFQENEELVRRFRREATAASKMSHDNIVRMLDVGSDGGMQYLVMEYVEGRTLKQIITSEGRLSAERAVKYALRILAALDHAHKRGIVHRDIKPQNILVDNNDVIKVADFGIARLVDNTTGTLSDSNTALGTVQYMSPEQANGDPVDERGDLYSLGIVIYEMLTGEVPFSGDNAVAIAVKQMREVAMTMRSKYRDIPRSLDEVVFKAIEKQPDHRYQDARSMAKDLSRALRQPKGGYVKSYEENKPLGERIRSFLNTALVVLSILVVVTVVTYGFIKVRDILYGVDVPYTIGMTREEANEAARLSGMEALIVEQYSYDVEKGRVISQSPAGGTRSRKNRPLTLTVSGGTEPQYLPDTTGMSRVSALELLSDNGFPTVYIEYDCVKGEDVDTVLRQSPNEGTAQYGQSITLTVNSAEISMPLLAGQSRSQALGILDMLGLNATITTGYSADDAPDTVLMQNPPAGTGLIRGSTVNLMVTLENVPEYYGSYSLKVPLDMNVRMVLLSPSGTETEVYSGDAVMDEIITPELKGSEPGTYTLTVFFDGESSIIEALEFQ